MLRNITQEDAYDIVAIGEAMHNESGYKELNYSPEKCYNMVCSWLQNEDFLMLCDEKDGEIRGVFIACLLIHPYGTDGIAQDVMFYVKPKYRGTSIAYRMIKAYEEWANNNEAKRIVLAHSCEIDDNKLDKMFSRLGFEQFASAFKKGI